ncbi:uncharacterized protein LY89DRAFT_736258 [Mollisia scopiformis]|uniref:Uncharacterized protein n=1 Tax=Mollisia scopiformis TaxID=149040 RepID=A0A194X1Y6_MOLSC|nr:uncharacterized protein LY89DRAFT_736258 [Mollisia scopiformis]KUJ14210.1 hypothetical protein LY89DRAFT_736258 [Mollisia scopiformis]
MTSQNSGIETAFPAPFENATVNIDSPRSALSSITEDHIRLSTSSFLTKSYLHLIEAFSLFSALWTGDGRWAEGSIADYDLILSISAEAINRQFKILYDTKIRTSDDFKPPSPLAAPAEYLLYHRLEIHLDKKGKPNPNYGLSAFIDCPQVSFDGLASKVNDYRTAKISIKFIKEGNVDSKFKEPYITEVMQIEIQETIVTGWTMSWEVKLGRHDIQDIMAATAFKDLHELNRKEAEKAKADGVDSRNFLVSSIFCVFQAAQMANTFQLRNPEGKLLELGEAPGDFTLTVSKYFTGMQVKEGQMTPDNPFVLGYGISQELLNIKEVNSEIKQPSRNTHGETNPSAGVLDQTLFNKTRTSSHDGVMAFCKEIIFDKYICENLGSKFLMDPKLIVKGLCQWNGSSLEEDNPVETKIVSQNGRPPVFKMERKFKHHMYDADETFMKNRREVEGSTWVELSMTSDLLDNPTSLIDKDAKRRTYIDVLYGANVNHRNQTQGRIGSLVQMEAGWSTQY